MFIHTIVSKKEIDLDQLLEDMKTKPEVVNSMIAVFGDINYSFIIKCVEDQIQHIKEYTPMPLEEEDEEHMS